MKSITFKKAFVIVICIHLVGAFGLVQLASLKAKLARIDWRDRVEARYKSNPHAWPEANNNMKITRPTPKPSKPSDLVAIQSPPKQNTNPAPSANQQTAVNVGSSSKHKETKTIYTCTTEYKNGRMVSRIVSSTERRPIQVTPSRISNSIQIIPMY